MKDIYIKDEGDFATVCAMTPAAQQIFAAQELPNNYPQGHKFDCDLMELYKVVAFAATHRLTVDSEVSIIIPSKN